MLGKHLTRRLDKPHCGQVKTYLCKMTGGLGCLWRLTCSVWVVGLYLQDASLLPRPLWRRCTPITVCPSGCLTSRGWDDMTLTGAGGMAGAETAQYTAFLHQDQQDE